MATKLKNLKLTSVDLVRSGANQEADICLYKSADPQEAPELPPEDEKGIFKRFINWLFEEAENAPYEPQKATVTKEAPYNDAATFNEVEEYQEANEILDNYLDALEDSFISIQLDEDLDESQKNEMMLHSLAEFDEAMEELIPELAGAQPWEETHKSTNIEEISEIDKFNQNHDRSGRFASAGGAASGGGGGIKQGKGGAYREDVDTSWGKYDQSVGRAHLANYGRIYLDEYSKPIDDEFEMESRHRKFTRGSKTKKSDNIDEIEELTN